MRAHENAGFLEGLTAGMFGSAVGTSAVLYLLRRQDLVSFQANAFPDLTPWLDWAYANLGSSIPVFAALLIVFFFTMSRLRASLADGRPVNEVIQLDHLAETWTTLFFGTGVIWTAIGMRSALLFALGEPDATVQAGAFAVLKKLVDGGILLALSTTIFGGVGGYLMRVYKSMALGAALQQRYDTAARADTTAMRDSLSRIERRLAGHPADDQEP
ncbi:MAG: hypothetical protein OEW59_10665 [Gammaproteobacteria bacterium]|nr:hypothetical protein [Gammaproteobacteria bacterium]